MIRNTSDIKFTELCEEIDMWKAEAEHWKEKYNEMRMEYHALSKNYSDSVHDSIGQLLSIALRAEDTKEGVLIRRDTKEEIEYKPSHG